MAINSKKKGSRGERSVVHLLNTWSGIEFQRTPQSGGLRWKKSDNISGDIICTEPNFIFPFSIEVKFHQDINFEELLRTDKKKVKIKMFWDQALQDSERAKKLPLLFLRYNGLPKSFHFIVMLQTHFKKFKPKLDLSCPYLRVNNGIVIMHQGVLLNSNFSSIIRIGKKILKVHG